MTKNVIQMEPLKVYQVKVEQTTGKNKGKEHFLVVRSAVDGKLTVPRGYTLLYVVCEVGQ